MNFDLIRSSERQINKVKISVFVKFTYFVFIWRGDELRGGLTKFFLLKRGLYREGGLQENLPYNSQDALSASRNAS